MEMMQRQMEKSEARFELLAEKIGGGDQEVTPRVGGGSGSKSRAKGKHPETLDRDVDYATFLQWEK